jgi:alkylation response protein AidB-like acyl-CoA dehydrogenase
MIILFLILVGALLFVQAKPRLWIPAIGVFLILWTCLAGISAFIAVCSILYFLVLSLVLITPLRILLFSRPLHRYFKKVLPPMSETERQAIEAGDVWWEGELFAGRPNWKKLHSYPIPTLTEEEQAFIDKEVETLCHLVDDWKMVQEERDMPVEVWQYLKENRFFGMVIERKYGGKGFSAFAHSSIIAKIATRSLSTAVNTMVPNSLGPGELLHHYGTEAQKNYYLPRLACGEEIPCFALTGIDAGSDAGAMTDTGIVCKGMFEGKETIGIRLNWNKRYITLAPVATVIGLAFKLFDPEHLLGEKVELGITVCLLPAKHPGVEIGRRHYPMSLSFMNGPIVGKDVFIPLDWIIGGPKMIGHGWRMLMESLSIGRGISLPALGTAGGLVSYRMTGAYAFLRKQFKVSIGEFEGIQDAMAHIGGSLYILESCRRMTAGAVDLKIKPAVASAIAKYHLSEINRKVLNVAMDIHGGRAVQMGPRNYFGHAYFGIPVGITVEGANILTRNLIIFGQGAIRCHPYILAEMRAAAANDVKAFDKQILSHVGFTASNFVRALVFGLSNAYFVFAPMSPLAPYYRQLTRMSTALAVTTDFAMLILGGHLKRKESLSARLGDVLSQLYLASTVLKYHADQNSPMEDLPYVKWALEKCLHEIDCAFNDFFRNFPRPGLAKVLQRLIFPLGRAYPAPNDELSHLVAQMMLEPSEMKDRLTKLCYLGTETDPLGRVEHAFAKVYAAQPILDKISQAVHEKRLAKNLNLEQQITQATSEKIITIEEAEILRDSEMARRDSLQVDDFT